MTTPIPLDDEAIRLLRDSAAAIAPPGGDFRRIRALRYHLPGIDPAVWRQIGELGWLGLRVAEAAGGAGLGVQALCALARELGAGLVPEPILAAAVIAPLLPPATLAAVLDGTRIILPAWQERANSLDAASASVLHDGRLSAHKVFVPMAACAHGFLVSTRDGLALLAADAEGVSLTTEPTQDGGHFGTLRATKALSTPVAGALGPALEEATLATAAYLLGVMDRVFALTLDYLRTREQFGRKIGSFQALQHRAADLHLQIELTRASIDAAAATLDAGASATVAACAVSRAKARAAEAALLVTRQAIQLHGGIAYTDEYDAGLFLRKAMVLANLHGSAALHRARYARLAPPEDADDD